MLAFSRLPKVRRRDLFCRVSHVLTCLPVMNVLRMIKLFGWESKISERLRGKREDELHWIRKIRIWTVINTPHTTCQSVKHPPEAPLG